MNDSKMTNENNHETYRTSYHLVDNQPLQKIHPRVDFRLEYRRSSPEEAEEMVIGLKKPFQYSTSLFKQETVERMIADFFNILESIIENPGISLSQIELRPGEET